MADKVAELITGPPGSRVELAVRRGEQEFGLAFQRAPDVRGAPTPTRGEEHSTLEAVAARLAMESAAVDMYE